MEKSMNQSRCWKVGVNFISETPQGSPRPQASSTFMHSDKTLSDHSTVGSSLKEKTLIPENGRKISNGSSLGLLDMDAVSGFAGDLTSSAIRSHFAKYEKTIEEEKQASKTRLSQRFDELSSVLSSEFDTSRDDDNEDEISPVSKIGTEKIRNAKKYSFPTRPLSPVQASKSFEVSSASCEFMSSDQIAQKLEEDEKKNQLEFGSIPVSPAEFSVESEGYASSGLTNYLQAGSYRASEISKILRNLTNKSQNTPEQREKEIVSSLKKNTTDFAETFGETYNETSLVSTLPSINQFAKMLEHQSAEPDDMVERLLSKGVSKVKRHYKSNTIDDKFQTVSSTTTPLNSVKNKLQSGTEVDNDEGKACSKMELEKKNHTLPYLVDIQNSEGKQRPDCTPPSGFYKLVKKTSDFEEYDSPDDASECSAVSSYICLTLSNPKLSPSDLIPGDPNATVPSACTGSHMKLSRVTDWSMQTSLNSEMSRTGPPVDPVKEVTASQNISCLQSSQESKNETADMVGGVINGGHLCIGTQVKVVLSIVNPEKKVLMYKVKLSNVSVNGKTCLSAASIMISSLVVSVPSHSDSEVSVVVAPLNVGVIRVAIEFISQQPSLPNMLRTIEVIGAVPSLKIIQPSSNTLYFGTVPECSLKALPFIVSNESPLRLPLKIAIYEDHQAGEVVYCAKIILEPGEKFECDVAVSTPDVAFSSEKDSVNVLDVSGKLKLFIDTSEEKLLGSACLLHTVQLSANVGRTSVDVKTPLPLKLIGNPYSNWQQSDLCLRNTGVVPLDIRLEVHCDNKNEFSLQPATLKILPFTESQIKVGFKPVGAGGVRKARVLICVEESSKTFSVPIEAFVEECVVSSSSVKEGTLFTPRSSSSGTSCYAEGTLELSCTHKALTWTNTPVYEKRIETVTVRNKNNFREKLIFSVIDAYGCFKIVDGDRYIKETKLVLEANESRKISIAFIPYAADKQVCGRVKMSRRYSPESYNADCQKRVLPLYGYGGTPKISIQNVFRDSESRVWLNLDMESLEAKFIVENTGDVITFLKLVQEEPDDVMYPEEILLLPQENVEVTVRLRLSAERVDLLRKRNRSKNVVILNKLILFYGSEATRQRIQRLWETQVNLSDAAVKKLLDTAVKRIADKVDTICDFATKCQTVNVRDLHDPLESLTKLWYEGIQEESAGILIDRECLESLCLDTSVMFRDLDTTLVSQPDP